MQYRMHMGSKLFAAHVRAGISVHPVTELQAWLDLASAKKSCECLVQAQLI